MAAVMALKTTQQFRVSECSLQSIEEKALEFFALAELSGAPAKIDGVPDFQDSDSRLVSPDEKALDFFTRAELSETLQSIWDAIKHLPFSTLLKLLKATALVSAAILLANSISLPGLLALAGAIAGLLFAAISNALVWLIYVPLYAVRTSDFAFSILLALGLAWLGGVSPLVALVFSPLMLFGLRLAERSQGANQNISAVVSALREKLEPVNLGTGLQKAAASLAGFAGRILP